MTNKQAIVTVELSRRDSVEEVGHMNIALNHSPNTDSGAFIGSIADAVLEYSKDEDIVFKIIGIYYLQ